MSKGDNQRPAAIPAKEVNANFERLGMLGTRTKSPEDGSCGHQRRVLRNGLFHCTTCDYVQPEAERIVFEEMDHPRTCARCGNPRPKGVNSCQQPCVI